MREGELGDRLCNPGARDCAGSFPADIYRFWAFVRGFRYITPAELGEIDDRHVQRTTARHS
jgi:hypothetical protein